MKRRSQSSVFLSHSGADATAARQLAELLRTHGVNVWLDSDNLRAGEKWMAAIETAILTASAMLVYIGRTGVQQWVDREVRLAIERSTQQTTFTLIPVLGEGADPKSLPPFLLQHHYVDLRETAGSDEGIRRILRSLRTQSVGPAIPSKYWLTHSPFRGLRSFESDDAWLFFGRDAETGALLSHLSRSSVLAVIGNSGSGKSSLVRAGLIPAIVRGRMDRGKASAQRWRIALFRPSEQPFGYLAEMLSQQLAPEMGRADHAEFTRYCRLALPEACESLRNAIAAIAPNSPHNNEHVLLIVDQFEELFTLTTDPAVRKMYIESLLTAASIKGAVSVRLVIVLRADFYAHCLEYPALRRSLENNIYNVGPIEPSTLRRLVERRLALANGEAEQSMLDTLFSDLSGSPSDLALVEHALDQLWERCGGEHRLLTNLAYNEIGRLQGALEKHATAVYEQADSDEKKGLIRKIVLNLIHYNPNAPETRTRVSKQALLGLGCESTVEAVLTHLASNRLVSISQFDNSRPEQQTVEVSHEALIRHWPMLRGWIEEDKAFLLWRDRLSLKIQEWNDCGHEDESLLGGSQLSEAEKLLIGRKSDLPGIAQEYIRASIAFRVQKEAERRAAAAAQHELQLITRELTHQLRSPLNQLGLRLRTLAKMSTLPADLVAQMRAATALWSKVRHVTNMSQLYADLAVGDPPRLFTSKINGERVLSAVNTLVEDLATLFAPDRRIKWKVTAGKALELRDISLDQGLFEQALRNVLDNAAKYSFPETTVDVVLKGIRDTLTIDVSNVGLRVAAADVVRAKERGYRGAEARAVTGEGAGLGLWITDQIMVAHGGRLEVLPTDKNGRTVVRLVFPILNPKEQTSHLRP